MHEQNRKKRPLPGASFRTNVPDGWFVIDPQPPATHSSITKNNPSSRQNRRSHDALGLTQATDPLTFLFEIPNKHKKPTNARAVSAVRTNSPRHQKLQIAVSTNNKMTQPLMTGAFSPHQSSQFVRSLSPVGPELPQDDREDDKTRRLQLNQNQQPRNDNVLVCSTPLHELVKTFDDVVNADPRAESNQAAVTQLFMEQWLQQFYANRYLYKSIVVHAEVGFQELYRLTSNLPVPNELITAFCCTILDELVPHFGAYAPLMRVIYAELQHSIYAPNCTPPVPYFAMVKNQKRLLVALQNDKKRREERNAFIVSELGNVRSMFLHFLDECAQGLVRTLFREWYSVAVVRKKNSKKYIEYFSAWFSASAKSLAPKSFLAWKHYTTHRRMEKIRQRLLSDNQKLDSLQRQVDELSAQRDMAQLETLAIQNDRKQIEGLVHKLNRKIQSVNQYLETSHQREAIVCQEGQLRAEAVSFLPPLVLESLLRGYHSVGFLQQLHHEFLLTPSSMDDDDNNTTCAPITMRKVAMRKVKSSLLQECLTQVIKLQSASKSEDTCSSSSVTNAANKISVQEFATFFRSIKRRIEASGANVLFASTAKYSRDRAQPNKEDSPANSFQHQFSNTCNNDHEVAVEVASEYEQVMRCIRLQDEHYARHSKLFSSRILECHEVSVLPTHSVAHMLDRDAREETESEFRSSSLVPSVGDLGIINGIKRFSIANKNLTKIAATNPTKVTGLSIIHNEYDAVSENDLQSLNPASNGLYLITAHDFEMPAPHSHAFATLFVAQLASEYGSLLFSPADMSVFTHNLHLRKVETLEPSTTTIDEEREDDQDNCTPSLDDSDTASKTTNGDVQTDVNDGGLRYLVMAFDIWNRISSQLIEAQIVQLRGGCVPTLDAEKATIPVEGKRIGSVMIPSGARTDSGISSQPSAFRPRILHQIEPLPQSTLLSPPRKKESYHGRKASGLGETYHTARIQKISADDVAAMTAAIDNVHNKVSETSSRVQDFHVAKQQISDFRYLQWNKASELASQFISSQGSSVTSHMPSNEVAHLRDERKDVYECISFDNNVMERIFGLEENPAEDLINVRKILETKKHLVRHLYTKHRANIHHAVSLSDLWHFVKVLRLPRETHMLPTLRDDDFTTTAGYEQLFSPDDLAEILLQLCNEQFLPQGITPLSARVDHFLMHHLPFAVQNQSIIRDVMHHSDVKQVLVDHSQTLRTIFRRYYAKEREHNSHNVNTGSTAKHRSRGIAPSVSKFMRLGDWLAFVQDYKLPRARFTLKYAETVFRNVQQIDSSADDQLEMIYSEFCEAIVAVAACFFPDPFLKYATKVNQFIRRHLPVSPEDIRDHA